MEMSLSQRILQSKKPFVLYHTYSVTNESLAQAITQHKSMDLDVCVDDEEKPYIGHSQEFYRISGETQLDCLPLWEAVEKIVHSNIAVIVDCKHYETWPLVEEVIREIGAHRCLVHSYVSELKFDYNLYDYDYPTEWSPIANLVALKKKFPSVTTTASCKFLPEDFLVALKYRPVWEKIKKIAVANQIDTLCLNIPNIELTKTVLDFFFQDGILLHTTVDRGDLSKISGLYVGETNTLNFASQVDMLGY